MHADETTCNAVRVEFSGEQVLADIRARFGARLRQVRLQTGLSQEKLGEKAGLHRTFVSMVERGERNVTIATVEKLAKALGCRMGHLMPDCPVS